MQNIQPIPFHQLAIWDGNVRRTGSSDGIEGLAASIAAHGLLQPLVVKDSGDGSFAVIAGRRRFLALQQLVESGIFAKDAQVGCTVLDDASDNTEISLVENALQLPMHPADKFEAFRDLADKGMTACDIAARFGAAESTVIKLMKLGRVSPEVMQAYREGTIDYAQIQAFTLSDDREAQNKVLESIKTTSWKTSPDSIRSELVKDEIPATDKRVRFVGLEFYEMCGGTVRRDLFDDENSGYIQDVDLLRQLVESKFQSTVDELKAEGWKWVEAQPDCDWQYRNQFAYMDAQERELTPEEAQKLEAMTEEYEGYQEQGFDEESEDNPEIAARMLELQQAMEAIEASMVEWSSEAKVSAGVLVSLKHDGSVEIERGLVKPEDIEPSDSDGIATENGSSEQGRAKPEFSAALYRSFTEYRTAALRIELARNPNIALVAVVHALAVRVFYSENSRCLKISGMQRQLFTGKEPIPSLAALEEEHNAFPVPEDSDELWSWCLERSQEELLKLLAVCAAYSLDAVWEREGRSDESVHADQLACALSLDMRNWFSATAENTFNRISRKQIIQAYIEVTGEQPSNAVLDLKKKDLAIRAEREIGGKWLPSVLRQPEPATGEEQDKSVVCSPE